MLIKIAPRAVTLGMYVHAFRGGWLSHPFWRGRFLLTDPADVESIRNSEMSAVVIDLDRGIGPAVPSRPAPRPKPRAPALVAEDRQIATRVVGEARRVMKHVFDDTRLGKAVDMAELSGVVRSISQSLDRNPAMLLGMIRLKSQDEYTYFHSVSVCALMANLARELGLDDEQVHQLGLAGLLHDIGKTAVSEAILNKPGRLTAEEYAEVREHARRGHSLLTRDEEVPELALDVCLHHHEKIDGTGYPMGLRRDEISLAARMGAICDVYDALTSVRPYKAGLAPAATVAKMASWEGHFDPDLLFTFMKSIGVFPIGMLVRMGGDLAIVRDNGRRASRARFTSFYDLGRACFVEPRDHFLSDLAGDLQLEPADPEDYGFEEWPELRERLLTGRPAIAGPRPIGGPAPTR